MFPYANRRPSPEPDASEKAAQTYGRLKELFEADAVPDVFLTMGRAPALLSDFYMNFKKFVWKEGKLDRRTKLLIALSVALKEGSGPWADFYAEQAARRGRDGRAGRGRRRVGGHERDL